ncbi:MAG: metallo-beta-lactamase superfamily protein [Polyangiaceae bacterium]|jgi:glyoxylase-like metal-dependent hydrolase (beta-lactamase superfamily II)|nr:metallo-beta-lactamase superfamily protein [Polyangiaceae bacterium]
MRIQPFFDARTFTLTYVVFDEATRDAVVVDPVLDYEPVGSYTFTESVDRVTDFIRREQLRVHYVLETHAHADHLTGAQLLRRRFDARIVIGASIRVVQSTFKEVFSLGHLATDGSQFDRLLSDGDSLQAGSLRIEAIATPGHTPACMTYKIDDALLTGDLLFMDDYGTGRCDFPQGSASQMFESVQKLYRLPDETRVFPGHDYPPSTRDWKCETTIGAEKAHNPQLSATTTKAAFLALREARDRALASPKLLFPSVQVNIDGGRMPPAKNGKRYLVTPINLFRPADELGEPI